METFRYYIVWQRKGNYTMDDAIIQVANSIATENGITEAKKAVATQRKIALPENVILVKWTRLD